MTKNKLILFAIITQVVTGFVGYYMWGDLKFIVPLHFGYIIGFVIGVFVKSKD